MPANDKMRAAVQKIQDGEISPPHAQPIVVPLVRVEMLSALLKNAHELESEISALVKSRASAIAKARNDMRDMRPEFLEAKLKEIWERGEADIDALLTKLNESATLMNGQRSHYTRAGAMTRATFDKDAGTDATIRSTQMIRLQRLTPAGLIDAAREAAGRNDAAAAGVIT